MDASTAELVSAIRQHTLDCAEMTRRAALDIVNGAIVIAEDKGLQTVPISVLRLLADHIARLPLPRK